MAGRLFATVAALAVLVAPAPAFAQAVSSPLGARREAKARVEAVAVLTEIAGQVEIEEDGRWRPARALDRVAGPARVRTGEDGRATLVLPDGSVVALGPGAAFALEPRAGEPIAGTFGVRLTQAGPVPGVPGYGATGPATLEVRASAEGAEITIVAGGLRAPDGTPLGAGATWTADPPAAVNGAAGQTLGAPPPPLSPLDAVGPPGAAAAEQGGLEVLIQ